jgi:nucleoid-associated protein YgaU
MSRRAWTRPLGLAIAAVGAAWVLWRMGAALPLPRSLTRSEIDRWLRDEGAPAAVFTLARVVALLASAYAACVGLLGVAAAVTRAAALSRVTVRLAIPALRPLLAPLAAATITIAGALPVAAQGRSEPRPPVPVMQLVAGPTTTAPVMTLVVPSVQPAQSAMQTHTVQPGDSFWSIAEGALRAAGHEGSDAEIAPYWRSLIDSNRDRLRVRDDPDLIYPGQVFLLPPIS